MQAEDVTDTLDIALKASGCDSATVLHKPRLLSDNGPSYIAGELAEYLGAQIKALVEYYNHQPCHESLYNVTPADAYFGRALILEPETKRRGR